MNFRAAEEPGCTVMEIDAEKDTDVREAVSEALMAAGCAILSMQESETDFEEAFLRLTSGKGEAEA